MVLEILILEASPVTVFPHQLDSALVWREVPFSPLMESGYGVLQSIDGSLRCIVEESRPSASSSHLLTVTVIALFSQVTVVFKSESFRFLYKVVLHSHIPNELQYSSVAHFVSQKGKVEQQDSFLL